MTEKGQDPKDKLTARPRSERKRYLNIIYFIDSHRTRTLKFSIHTGYLSVGLAILLVAWTFISGLWFMQVISLNNELRLRSRYLLSVIFNYQTRYDEVYEKAYPNELKRFEILANSDESIEKKPAPAKDMKENKKVDQTAENQAYEIVDLAPTEARPIIAVAAKSLPEPDATETPETTAQAASTSSPKEKVITKLIEETPKLSSVEPLVVVEKFSSTMVDKKLTIRFALKNTNRIGKTKGQVTAEASFLEAGKEAVWIASKSISEPASDNTDPDEPNSDTQFNIRVYKNKALHFIPPENTNGSFTSVRIRVKDDHGRSKQFSYPLSPERNSAQSLLKKEESDIIDSTDEADLEAQ